MQKLLVHAFAVLLTSTFISISLGDEPAAARVANRPAVPGRLQLHLRDRKEATRGSGKFDARDRIVEWDTAKTAIIVCDMWDNHYCQSSAQRVGVMVPKMNAVLTAARNHGVTIIHAPSGTVDMYANTPFRRRVQQAPAATPPVPIAKWCYLDPKSEPPLPIVDSKSPCDDAVVGAPVKVFSKQHPGLDITGFDGVSDSGDEIFNFCEELGITNIALMGVHTNMCVLGRPFGIRQQVRLGRNVVLVRDLTDAMYDPREPPFVSHTRGTELVIEHIEAHWCPSIHSDDLTKVVAGSADPVTKSVSSENQTKASRLP
jgi:nicotinamidase-related amidase